MMVAKGQREAMATKHWQRIRRFVAQPFLILGAGMKESGGAGMAGRYEGSTFWLVSRLRSQIGEVWWQIGVALQGKQARD